MSEAELKAFESYPFLFSLNIFFLFFLLISFLFVFLSFFLPFPLSFHTFYYITFIYLATEETNGSRMPFCFVVATTQRKTQIENCSVFSSFLSPVSFFFSPSFFSPSPSFLSHFSVLHLFIYLTTEETNGSRMPFCFIVATTQRKTQVGHRKSLVFFLFSFFLLFPFFLFLFSLPPPSFHTFII
jgi:hypothetical protein